VHFIEWIVHLIRDPGALIVWGGYPGLALIIFLETGAMTFFLPGDSLLVMAGLYAAKGDLSLLALNALLIPMAIMGDATSYLIGAKTGPRIFDRPRSRFFRPEHVKAAHGFYEKHGGKAIILARFMPLVRTFVPVVAGVAGMTYRRFATYNVVGGAAWVLSMTTFGYFLVGVANGLFERLGLHGANGGPLRIEDHVEKVVLVVVFLSILPGIIEYLRARRRAATK
jgi:membrane-associated protein